MKEKYFNIGGLLLFYLIIIGGILLLNLRFSYLNTLSENNNITMNN